MKKYPNKKELNFESNYIAKQRVLIFTLLEQHYEQHPNICVFEKVKTKKLLNRSFDSEIDFLHEDSQEYFELFLSDHIGN